MNVLSQQVSFSFHLKDTSFLGIQMDRWTVTDKENPITKFD